LPPWLIAGVAREALQETFARARWLLASYWLLTGSGYVALVAAALSWWEGNVTFAVVLVLSSLVGALVGNLLGLLRVRTWLVQLAIHLLLFAGLFAVDDVPLLTATVFAGLWSLGCGHAALQRRGALWSLWIPVICWTAAIFTVLEYTGRFRAWRMGEKGAVWDPLTLAMLFLVVLEFFLFLAGQESYHRQVWRAGAVTTPVTFTQHRAVGATRVTKRGVFALLVFALLATGFTAKLAPYLWRTGPQEARRDNTSPSDGREAPRPRPEVDWDALARALERTAREAQQRARDALPFLPLFLFRRPLRRAWLLRHWRRPMVSVTPTERANNLWRYVTIALDDVDQQPRRGESYEQTIERFIRVRAARGEAPPEGLAETRTLYERVRFGLGIPTGALDELQVQAERAFRSVRAPMTPWQRVKCWFRSIET
jgi:hypothetical protein